MLWAQETEWGGDPTLQCSEIRAPSAEGDQVAQFEAARTVHALRGRCARQSPGRNPSEVSVSLVGHASVAHGTHASGLAGWSAGTSRRGEGVSSSGQHAMGALIPTSAPHPLCLGRVSYVVGGLESLAWPLHPWRPSQVPPPKALHSPNSCFSGCRYLG